MLYTIGLESELPQRPPAWYGADPDGRLKDVRRGNRWRVFRAQGHSDELGPTFTRVAQELHSQYVVGFAPSVQDGELHELEVRVRQRVI